MGVGWRKAKLDKFGRADGEMYDSEAPLSHKAMSGEAGARSSETADKGWD